MTAPVLEIRDLVVEFTGRHGSVRVIDGVSYDVARGETLGVVGESGSGKTVTVLAALGLLPRTGRIVSGRVLLDGTDLVGLSPRQLRRLRGRRVAMAFQDPMASLHPLLRVGAQIAEAVLVHNPTVSKAAAHARAAELLRLVGVPDGPSRMDSYPHHWSGGMRQRAMIAMAVANEPALLIADEPTTALDVTIQAQVLEVLRAACRETGSALVLITHDLGVIAEMADRVVVMYAGRVAETAPAVDLFDDPRHPYSVALLDSRPRIDGDVGGLRPVHGRPADAMHRPAGCPFHPRCFLRRRRSECCDIVPPLALVDAAHRSACHFHEELTQL